MHCSASMQEHSLHLQNKARYAGHHTESFASCAQSLVLGDTSAATERYITRPLIHGIINSMVWTDGS